MSFGFTLILRLLWPFSFKGRKNWGFWGSTDPKSFHWLWSLSIIQPVTLVPRSWVWPSKAKGQISCSKAHDASKWLLLPGKSVPNKYYMVYRRMYSKYRLKFEKKCNLWKSSNRATTYAHTQLIWKIMWKKIQFLSKFQEKNPTSWLEFWYHIAGQKI